MNGRRNINLHEYPANGDMQDKLHWLLRFAVTAPSTHNTQPWKFKINENILEISPDLRRDLPVADPDKRNLFISLGACAHTLILASQQYGLNGNIESIDKDKIKISFKDGKAEGNTEVLNAILRRHSHKFPFKDKQIDPSHEEVICNASSEATYLTLVTDVELKKRIALSHRDQIQSLAADTKFGRELSTWLKTNSSRHAEGMPGAVMGIRGLKLHFTRFLIRNIRQSMHMLARRDYDVILSSPALIVISTPGDTIKDWVAAGVAYQQVCIELILIDVKSTPLTAIMENPVKAQELSSWLGAPNSRPQMLLRIGYSDQKPIYTPRRAIDEALS